VRRVHAQVLVSQLAAPGAWCCWVLAHPTLALFFSTNQPTHMSYITLSYAPYLSVLPAVTGQAAGGAGQAVP
jgi:hypothetical protein